MIGRERSAWRSVAGYGLAAAAIISVARYVGLNGGDFVDAGRHVTWQAMVAAGLLFGLHLAINACAFSVLGRAFGMSLPARFLSLAWTATLLAKYVPGGVWQIAGRGILLGRHGVTMRTTIVSGVLEQLLSVGICGALAVVFYSLRFPGSWVWLVAAIVVVAAVGLVALPSAVRRWCGVPLSRRRFLQATSLYGLAMIPYGLGYVIVASPQEPLRFLGALFGGTVAGVLALPVPGGLGVREAVTSVLSSSVQPAPLLAALLACRMIILVVEVAMSAMSVGALRRSRYL